MLGLALVFVVASQADPDAALSDARVAVAKGPQNAEAKKALKTAFLEARHALIERTRDFERLAVTCPSLRGSTSTESCIRDHLERIATSSAFVEVEGDEMVSAVVMPGYEELFLTEGVVRGVRPAGDSVEVDLDVIRERGPRDPAVESVLFDAPPAHAATFEFTGPVLSREARKTLASLPPSFTMLSGDPSRRYVQEVCKKPTATIAVAQSILGQASFYDSPAGATTITAVTDVTRSPQGIKLTLKKGKAVDIHWPTPEKDVALRGEQAWAAYAAKFPVKPAKDCN